MTILKYNDKEVKLAPDLTLNLSTEKSERVAGDLQVVEQTSDLMALANKRIDDLVKRMNDFEAGAGSEWAVPLQREKTERLAGDLENKNYAISLNTAMSNRVDGLFTDITAVEDRVTALETEDTTIVRQGDSATLESLVVNHAVSAESANISGGMTVGSITNMSDKPWTKINDEGENQGTWVKRQGDVVYLRVKLDNSGAAVSERWVGTLPDWAQLPAAVALMYTVPQWTTTASNASNVQVHGNSSGDTNRNKIAILKNAANMKYEFMISWAVGNEPG